MTRQSLLSYLRNRCLVTRPAHKTRRTFQLAVDSLEGRIVPTALLGSAQGLFSLGASAPVQVSEYSSGGVRYADGAIGLSETDLSSNSFGSPWMHSRAWSNTPIVAASGVNGNGWMNTELPFLSQSGSSIIAMMGPNDAIYFDHVGSSYVPQFFFQATLTEDTPGSQFIEYDPSGAKIAYNDFSSGIPAGRRGQFKSFTDVNGVVTAVTSYSGDNIAEIQRSNGSVTDSYSFTYTNGLLQNVTLRRPAGGSWTTIRQVDYVYYDGSQSFGNSGDLEFAIVKDGSGAEIDRSYYRYYTTTDANAGTYQGGRGDASNSTGIVAAGLMLTSVQT